MNKEILEFKNLLNLLQSKENKLFNNKGSVELLFKYKTNFEINKKEIEFIGKVKVIISETLNKYEFQINFLPELFKLFLQLNSKKDLQNKLLDLKLNSILNLKEIEEILYKKSPIVLSKINWIKEINQIWKDNLNLNEIINANINILKDIKRDNPYLYLTKNIENWEESLCPINQFIPLFYYEYEYSWSYDYTNLYSVLGVTILKSSSIEFVFNIANIYHIRKTWLWRMDSKVLSWNSKYFPSVFKPFRSIIIDDLEKYINLDYKIFENKKEIDSLFKDFRKIAIEEFENIKPKWNPWIWKLKDASSFYEDETNTLSKRDNNILMDKAKEIIEKRCKLIARYHI